MGGGPIFAGRNKMLLLGEDIKFRVIFKKYEIFCGKMQFFRNRFYSSRGTMGKIRKIRNIEKL